MSAKSRFLKTFVDLPISERSNVAAVIDGNPLSWNVVKIEIEAETKIGSRVLAFLDKNDLLKKDD